VQLRDPAGAVIDELRSYTAMALGRDPGRPFMLNNRPLQLQLVLDQGYWQESGLTAPTTMRAPRRGAGRQMGFNGVRKHQKIEDPALPVLGRPARPAGLGGNASPYRFARIRCGGWPASGKPPSSATSAIRGVVAWVPFNESWGVPDLPYSRRNATGCGRCTDLTKTLEPTRRSSARRWEIVATTSSPSTTTTPHRSASPNATAADANRSAHAGHERPGYRNLLLDASPTGTTHHG